MKDEPKEPVVKQANRPDLKNVMPEGVMFDRVGPTGWGRIRKLGNYKGNRSEANFADQDHKWSDPNE
jgi:hypothetical protein